MFNRIKAWWNNYRFGDVPKILGGLSKTLANLQKAEELHNQRKAASESAFDYHKEVIATSKATAAKAALVRGNISKLLGE